MRDTQTQPTVWWPTTSAHSVSASPMVSSRGCQGPRESWELQQGQGPQGCWERRGRWRGGAGWLQASCGAHPGL